MSKVKYKDKNREFEMPSDTFLKTFSQKVILELIKPTKPKSTWNKVFNYLKSIPTIASLLNWLGIDF